MLLLKQVGHTSLKRAGEAAAGMLSPRNLLVSEHLCVLGAIITLVTIATELTTNRANMHPNSAGDRAKRATLFVELSNCVSLLAIQLVVSHCKLVFYHDLGVIDSPLEARVFVRQMAICGTKTHLASIKKEYFIASTDHSVSLVLEQT